jgi:hypothetical protein
MAVRLLINIKDRYCSTMGTLTKACFLLIKKVVSFIRKEKRIEYKPSKKGGHDLGSDLFALAMKGKIATGFKVEKIRKGFRICVSYAHDPNSTIEYYFKYNVDSVLLLSGVSINKVFIIARNSIPDFAISARPLGEMCKMEWVPAHGRIKNVSLNNKIEIKHDSNSFEVIQTFEAVNPNSINGKMWEHTVGHRISIGSPYLEISNEVRFMEDTEVNKLFLTMLPASSKNVDKLYLGNGVFFSEIANDGTHINDSDAASSAMYVKENESTLDYVAAVETDIKDPIGVKISFRKDNVTKTYINGRNGLLARKGDEIISSQRIVCITSRSRNLRVD